MDEENETPELSGGEIALNEERDLEEVELGVPEEEGAKSLNVGNIIMAALLAFVVIVGVVALFLRPKKQKKEEAEMLGAGQKYEPEIAIKKQPEPEVFERTERQESPAAADTEYVLSTLPPEFQSQPEPSQAPVAAMSNSGSSPSYQRPDTRNSRSARKVEGIAGQDYKAQSENNRNIVSAVMGGGYPQAGGVSYPNPLPSKEEYLRRLDAAAGTMASYGNASQQQAYQANKENFFNAGAAGAGRGEWLSYASLWEGTVISAALQTGINTDNPGLVIARVTENVYSSYDSSFLLVPEGTLLYATYNSSISYGQNRIQVAWNLMVRPDGYKAVLGNMNGVDAQGASGYKGRVTNHPFQTLKALGLVAVFSIIQTEVNSQIKSTENQYLQNVMSDTYAEASKIGSKIVDRALDIKPTIKIKPGTEVKLITNTTLELPPVKVNPVTRRYVRTR